MISIINLNFPQITSVVGIFTLLLILFFSFILIGILVGYKTIYRKTLYDRQKIELRYKIYTKKWLQSLDIKIENLTTKRNSIPIRLYIISKNKNKNNNKVVIFHHGITSNHVAGYKLADIYMKKNYTFVCYDSRGWGDNSFNGYCTYGVFEKYDLLDVVKYLKIKYNFKVALLHGESMGGKTVLEYACNFDYLRYISGYVVDSGFVNFSVILKHNIKKMFVYIPYWFIYPFANIYIKYKTSKTISKNSLKNEIHKINAPILEIYSKSDSTIPLSESKIIADNAKDIRIFSTQNAPHVLSSVFYRDEYIKQLNDFIAYVERKKNEN